MVEELGQAGVIAMLVEVLKEEGDQKEPVENALHALVRISFV